ncbi:MAG: MFS transporter [Acidimicrobiales bacterium]
MRGRRLLIDTGPLRTHPPYRRLWSGYLVSTFGSEITLVAVPFQVYRMTHSTLDVGLVSLAQLGPLLVGSFGGGAIADAFNRRRLLVVTQLLLAATSLGLALNAHAARPALWAVFVASAAAAGISGVDGPTRTALVADLVERDSLTQAMALWQLMFSLNIVAGPALAGVLIGRFGLAAAYWVDVATFAVSLVSILRLSFPATTVVRQLLTPAAFLGGLRYLARHQVLQAVYLVDLNAMVFGMPRALFPALAVLRFHGGAETVGLLYAAPGAGALLGAASAGWVTTVRRQGLAVLVAVAAWGLAITAFGFATALGLALVLLVAAGAADVISAVFRSTILQLEAPEELRGRLQAVQTAVVTGGPRLGDLESGAVAAAIGVANSVIAGGAICLVGVAVLAQRLPHFASFVAHRRAPGGGAPGGSDVEG